MKNYRCYLFSTSNFSKKHISLVWIFHGLLHWWKTLRLVNLKLYLSCRITYLFKHQPHKMVKNTQKLCWLMSTKSLSVFEYFVELALKGLIWKMLPEEYFQLEPRIFLHYQYFYIQYRDSVLRKMWNCAVFPISISRRFFNLILNPIHATTIT